MKKYIFLIIVLILLLPNTFALISESSMKVFAVTGDGSAKEANLNLSVVDGTGRIFSSIDESIVGSLTQESFKNAVSVADKVIGENIKDNYNFTVDIVSNAYTIDGPSAGAAMSLLLISMFNDIELKDVSVTGSISSDGRVGDVGGIFQKSKRAAEIGIKLFFIPKGNRSQIITEEGSLEQIDLIEYAYTEWGLKIIEVSTIDDILKYAFEDVDSIDIDVILDDSIDDDSFYEYIEYSKALEPFKKITSDYVRQTEEKLVILKESINTTSIKDPDILQSLLQSINQSKELINISKKFDENNYLYSAANNSFLAYINVITVEEIVTNPSILADSSIIFDLRIKELEDKIKITENRSQNCSLDYFEWCVGARQRMTWARDKLESIKEGGYINNYIKIQDYAYAVAWTEIANSFLDISITNSQVKFVEANHFRDLAQKNIIEVENQLILVAPELANSDDLNRRLNASKRNFERGWYVTSLYDSATALSVIKTNQERNIISNSGVENKHTELTTILRSKTAMDNKNYVWSKMFLDHGIYYYNSYNFFKDRDKLRSDSHLNIANSIFNFSKHLYNIETIVIDFYFNVDPKTIVADITSSNEVSILIPQSHKEIDENTGQKVYVYSKEKDTNYFYILIAALFLMIIAIVVEVERFKILHSKEGILKQIGHLEEKLLEGKISKFSYNEMREKYISELQKIKEKENKKRKPILKDLKSNYNLEDKEFLDSLILELKRKKDEISSNTESDSIKSVKKVVSKIDSSKKTKKTNKTNLKKTATKKTVKKTKK